MTFQTKLKLDRLIESSNIAELLSDEDLAAISKLVVHEYELDLESRANWEVRNADSLTLALQLATAKTTPWPNCANVMYPLVTMAAMQSHAREYPALVVGNDLVKCRVIGSDADGLKTARAQRVSTHMSYQLLEEDGNWEEEMDRVLLTKAIVGTAFKKVYFNPILRHNVSESVLAQDLVIPYKAKSLERAVRITQKIELSRNDIYERVARNIFIDTKTEVREQAREAVSKLDQVGDTLQGQQQVLGDPDVPVLLLEQHRYLDLDGDGYAEPYIVTVEKESKVVRRIVARYFKDDVQTNAKGKILYIKPQQFFVKFGMIPSPDGGIYDIGFGALLGPINRTVNTIINQLIDAGTLATLGGGFLGRGAKLRRGQNQFVPGEWKQVEGSGADLKNSIVPLPVGEPSQVLYALLGMLVNAGERIVGATDMMTGANVGQNTPASTAQEMVKQGSVIFNSMFKRTYRSLKEEYRMLYRLNQLYLESEQSYEDLSTGQGAMILAEDYQGSDNVVRPSADPNISSIEKRMQQAMFLKQAAQNGPGYNPLAVERRLLEAAQIPYMGEVWNEQNPSPPNPKLMIEQAKLEFDKLKMQTEMQYKMLELMAASEKTKAEVEELQARAAKEMAEAQGVQAGHMIALIDAEIAAKKNKQDGIFQTVTILKSILDSSMKAQQDQQKGDQSGGVPVQANTGGMGAVASQPSEQGGTSVPTPLG